MKTTLEDKITEANRLLKEGYTQNEINEMLDLGMPKTEEGNVRYEPVVKDD